MSLVNLRRELEARDWDCQVMNLNENRRIPSSEYIDVQNGWDYLCKVSKFVWRGYAVHVRVNGETKKGYVLAFTALALARLARRTALLSYCGGHQQSFFPAPRGSFRQLAFSLLFRLPTRIYCNSQRVQQALLTSGIRVDRFVPIPHFSIQYVHFTPQTLPDALSDFYSRRNGVFFVYVCYRKEYMLELLAEAIRRFRASFPKIGFLLLGTSQRELERLNEFFRTSGLDDSVYMMGSVSHDLFLTLLTRSLAYIRIPVTDGVCSSVLESLTFRVPVLASDNGTRPEGVELWRAGDVESLLALMTEVMRNRDAMVARIPLISAEDNTCKLADDIEATCGGASSANLARDYSRPAVGG